MSISLENIIAESTKTLLAEITDDNGINAEKVAQILSEMLYEMARYETMIELVAGQVFGADTEDENR